MRSLAALAVLAAILLPGCGDGGDDDRSREGASRPASARDGPPPAAVQDLLRRVYGEASYIVAMDWQRARKELRLSEPFGLDDPQSETERQFESAAQSSASYLKWDEYGGPLAKAIDHDMVTASVDVTRRFDHEDELVLLATRAPRQRVVERLRRAGYGRMGDRLHALRGADPSAPYSTLGVADSLLAIGPADLVSSALARSRPAPKVRPLLGLLEHVDGARRAVQSVRGPRRSTCIRAVAGSEDFRDRDDFAIRVAGRAAAERVTLGGRLPNESPKALLLDDLRTSDIRADGAVVRMSIAPRDEIFDRPGAELPSHLDEPADAAEVYACP